MTEEKVTVIVGGSIQDDGVAFIKAWHRAERGERFQGEPFGIRILERFEKSVGGREKIYLICANGRASHQ